MAMFTPGQVERICASGRRLPREHFIARLQRSGEELDRWTLNECIATYFCEGRWYLMELLLDHADGLPGHESHQLRIQWLWCVDRREDALRLAREMIAAAPSDVKRLQETIADMEAGDGPEITVMEKWQRAQRGTPPSEEEVTAHASLLLYGLALDPWQAAAAMAIDDWEGMFNGLIYGSPRPRRHYLRKTGRWAARSTAEQEIAGPQVAALLETAGWPFPPPYRWPLRCSEIPGVEWVVMDIFACGRVRSGSLAQVDAWFGSCQLAALGELGALLEITRYP